MKNPKFSLSDLHNDRVVFPLLTLQGTFSIKSFRPGKIGNKCTLEEIKSTISEINKATNYLSPIRRAQLAIVISCMSFVVFFVFGFCRCIDAISANDKDSAFQGLITIAGSTVQLIALNMWGNHHWNASLPELYTTVITVLHHNKKRFLDKGLKWRVSETLSWIELTTDFKTNPVLYNYPSPILVQPKANNPEVLRIEKEKSFMQASPMKVGTYKESEVFYSLKPETLKMKLLDQSNDLENE